MRRQPVLLRLQQLNRVVIKKLEGTYEIYRNYTKKKKNLIYFHVKNNRFRVESSEVGDDVARLKESSSLSSSVTEKTKLTDDSSKHTNSLSRSQSVYTQKISPSNDQGVQGSLSKSNDPIFHGKDDTKQPALTLASSFTDKSKVTFGFDVTQDKKD